MGEPIEPEPRQHTRPSARDWRAYCVAAVLATLSALWSFRTHQAIDQTPRSDFAVLHAAARAFQSGTDPYTFIGPGRAYPYPFPLMYPFTAVLVAVPFTWVPFPDALFVAMGTGLFVFGVVHKQRYRWALAGLLSPAFIITAQMSQWPALLVGATLVPASGFLLACKPTIGAALFAAFPSARAAWGGAIFVLLSLVLLPHWPWSWLAGLPALTHMRAPVTFTGGPLVLLALLRWRAAEARLLVAMACIPHNTVLYETLPLFLIPRTGAQSVSLAVLNWAVVVVLQRTPALTDYVAQTALTGQWIVYLIYLPCLAMVLVNGRHELHAAWRNARSARRDGAQLRPTL